MNWMIFCRLLSRNIFSLTPQQTRTSEKSLHLPSSMLYYSCCTFIHVIVIIAVSIIVMTISRKKRCDLPSSWCPFCASSFFCLGILTLRNKASKNASEYFFSYIRNPTLSSLHKLCKECVYSKFYRIT